MTLGLRALVFILLVQVCPSAAMAEDRFWILWEKRMQTGVGCPNGAECRLVRNFTSRVFQPRNLDAIYRLFGALDGRALTEGRLSVEPDAPRICQHNASEVQLGFDPEQLAISDSLDALKGLRGVGVDLSGLKAPPGYSGSFGQDLQSQFELVLAQVGLPVVTPEIAQSLPGQPSLKIYFSFLADHGECDYRFSVFASLSQTALLTRDLSTKLSVGVWSFSTNSGSDEPAENEFAAIVSVAQKLARDFQKANAQ